MKIADLLRWRGESGMYLVAHPFLDLISQGPTPEDALRSFLDALALETLYRVGADGRATFRMAPFEVTARWARLAAENESNAREDT